MIILKIAVCVLAAFFAVCGIIFTAGLLMERLLRPERRRVVSIVPLRGDDAELILRAAAFDSGVTARSGRLFAIDRGLDAEQRRIVEKIASEIGGIEVVDSDTFCRLLNDGALD